MTPCETEQLFGKELSTQRIAIGVEHFTQQEHVQLVTQQAFSGTASSKVAHAVNSNTSTVTYKLPQTAYLSLVLQTGDHFANKVTASSRQPTGSIRQNDTQLYGCHMPLLLTLSDRFRQNWKTNAHVCHMLLVIMSHPVR